MRNITMLVDTMGVPAGSHATPSQKNKLEKKERPRNRCQGPARGQNTNDDDDDYYLLIYY